MQGNQKFGIWRILILTITFFAALLLSVLVYASSNNKDSLANENVSKSISSQNPDNDVQRLQQKTNIKEENKKITNEEKNVVIEKEITQKEITQKEITEKYDLPFEIIKKKNNTLRKGIQKVITEGKKGTLEKTFKVFMKNGKIISQTLSAKKIIKRPVNKVIEVGTAIFIKTSRGEFIRYSRSLLVRSSAYDAGPSSTGKGPGHPYYGITSTGIKVRKGVVAVDPSVIPMGTRMYIEGYGYGVAADKGSAIKGMKIDVFFPTRIEANNWGIRRVNVYILDN